MRSISSGRLADLRFEAWPSGGVARDAFKALHPLGSGTFKKAGTGHADTFELKADEGGRRYLQDWIKVGGTLLIVAVPEDEEVAATYCGAGAESEEHRPSLILEGEPTK